jgi:hypothetical protein
MERGRRIELLALAWKAKVLPLYEPREIYHKLQMNWSGRRVSNSRPQPWQGCALPTELLPLIRNQGYRHFAPVGFGLAPCIKAIAKLPAEFEPLA